MKSRACPCASTHFLDAWQPLESSCAGTRSSQLYLKSPYPGRRRDELRQKHHGLASIRLQEKPFYADACAHLLPLTSVTHSFGLIFPVKKSESADFKTGESVSLGRSIFLTAPSTSPASTSLPIWADAHVECGRHESMRVVW